MSGAVLAVSCRLLVAHAASSKQPTAEWLRSVGLNLEQLDDPDARLDPTTIVALWRRAYAELGDPALALHIAESLPRGAYRAVEYLAAHAPTVGDAYSKIADYFSVIDSTTELVIEKHSSHVGLGPRRVLEGEAAHPATEYLLTAIYRRVRDMTGVAHSPLAVDFTAQPQRHTAEIERVLECAVHWNAPANRLRFRLDDWNRPTSAPDPALLTVLQEHAQILKQRHPSSASSLQVLDQILDRAWDSGEPSIEICARSLGMSSRTLQRRLGEEGTSFSERVDASRKRTALGWLRCVDVSLAEVAYLVGFKEQASLTRAVRRWTGQTPGEFRRAQQRTRTDAS